MNAHKKDVPELDHDKKPQRAERFAAILKRHSMALHGAATSIANRIGVSDATVSAWMRGSLPRDPDVLIDFCDEFDVDLYWWVKGVARPRAGVDPEKLVRAFQHLTHYTDKNNLELTTEQTGLFLANIYDDPAAADEYLETMAPYFKKRAPVE